VGYEGRELFDLGSVQKIALYSKGIPRLINVICDNALLIAYATSKTTVSAKIIDDVARDLQLMEPSQVKGAEQPKEVSQVKASNDDKPWRRDFEQFPGRPPNQLHPKRSWAGAGIATVLAVVILAGTVLYSQQSGSLAALAVNLEDLVSARWKTPLQTQSPENITQEGAARLNRHHVQVTASRGSEFVLESPNGDSLVFSRIEPQKPRASSPRVDSRSLKSETALATSRDLDKQAPSEAKNKTKERSLSSGTLRVYDASFVRDKPRSDANITGTLEPGTRIRVQSKTGDYFHVRSLDREPISGYVHREDAFFEPAR
jgi:hypothetical protein